jgi:hypothetical protein
VAFVPQIPGGVTDRRQMTDRCCNPALLHPQIGYKIGNTPYGHSIIITELLTWVQGRMGLVALHDRMQTTTTTSDGKTFTAYKVQRHGCYQPTPMGNTPYGHSIVMRKILTWVHGRMGLVALHDRVQTTTTTSDCKIFTANKVQRYGCYQPTAMGNTLMTILLL